MLKVVYSKVINGKGRTAFVGKDKMTYEYADVPDEETFQKLKTEIVEELKKKDSSLVKASFYTEKRVSWEIAYEDIDKNDEYNSISVIKNMTRQAVMDNIAGMTWGMWELFNGVFEKRPKIPNDLSEADENSDPLYDYLKSLGPTILK